MPGLKIDTSRQPRPSISLARTVPLWLAATVAGAMLLAGAIFGRYVIPSRASETAAVTPADLARVAEETQAMADELKRSAGSAQATADAAKYAAVSALGNQAAFNAAKAEADAERAKGNAR